MRNHFKWNPMDTRLEHTDDSGKESKLLSSAPGTVVGR